jgi:hypothetical protein
MGYGSFDATQHQPKQGGEKHPIGKFNARVENTEIVPTKDNSGGMFVVTFETPVGSIAQRYNLWNNNPQAVEIAFGQLSALCHATGVLRINYDNPVGPGAELRNAQLMIEVADQIDKEMKLPNGYVHVKKVYDRNGNEPGKTPALAAQPQAAVPIQNANWQPATQNTAPAPNAGQQWGNQPAQQTAAPAAQPTQQAPNQAWQPGPTGQAGQATTPPWANK